MRRTVLLACLLAVLATTGIALAQSEGTLRGRISTGKAREQSLSAAIAHLDRLERATAHDVTVLQGRVAAVQQQLQAAEARARAAALHLAATRRRLARLQARLAQVRGRLAALLRERYENGAPNLLSVVVNAHSFSQLIESVNFVRRVQHQDADLLDQVRRARDAARREQHVLKLLTARRRAAAAAVRRHRDALAGVLAGLRSRQRALARARAARAEALQRTRAGRIAAEHALGRLLAQRARAAISSAGPGGPWAIPWAVVQCESGGQNLPPNSATASGYYQILDSTWHGLGGTTQHAYQAPKAEQDQLAAKLWAGGRGAHNWVCASLVGIV